ncbi:hypothetical protein ALC57_05248 [Trachymyrmex cornetzi]|uniref:THAP-type domain-containing protein n=1 Tax=Trachymyrmex cornetzi TaxID=471704 RepID=A0A151JB75_9HYME|nr:hypothetical protein ALC57_05248 [Trachymyrmex cornetzi]
MVGQNNFKPKKHSVICSDHFTPNDYEIRPGAYKPRLKECAIPLRCNNNENISVEISENLPEMIENNSNIEHSQKVHLLLYVHIYSNKMLLIFFRINLQRNGAYQLIQMKMYHF